MIGDSVYRLMMPGRLAALRQMFRFLMSKGIWVANPLQDGLNSKKYKTLSPGEGGVPVPTVFLSPLANPGFTVPFTSTVNVSGGGAALQTAVTAAGPGTRLLIQDSLTYDQIAISGKTNLTIQAATGQGPTIQAAAGPNNNAISIGAGNSGLAFIGLGLRGDGNQNGLSQAANGIILGHVINTGMATVDRIIVNNCSFSDANAALGVPGIQLVGTDGTVHTNVQIIKCTFLDCATPVFATGAGYGAVTVGGFNNVFVQNTKIDRLGVSRAASNMRGVVLKNITSTVEDVLCHDIGTGGSNESFKHNNEAAFGSVVGGTSTWRNCVAFNAHRGFRITQPGATMTVTHGAVAINLPGIATGQTIMQQSAGTLIVRSSYITVNAAAQGTAFTAATTEDHNDIFGVSSNGKVLDATDLTLDPVVNPFTNDYQAQDASVAVGGVGGTPMGVHYTTGTHIFWAGVP